MTATTATDSESPPVSYFFEFVDSPNSGSGGTSSGWQASPFYLDLELQPNHSYGYRVKARDSAYVPAETGYSTTVYRYTFASIPGSAPFSDVTSHGLRANWGANGNPAWTAYYCENVTKGTNSGWTAGIYWEEADLAAGTSYEYRVKARNGNGIETGWLDLGSQKTLVNVFLPLVVN